MAITMTRKMARSMSTSDDTRPLLQAYAERQDRAALTDFFNRYQDELYAFALRVLRNPDDAQDALQMAFLDVMRRADEHARIQSVRGWLFGIVRKACRVIVRSGQRRQHREDIARKERGRAMNQQPDAEQDSVDLKDAVLSILLRLPERYRDPVMLCCCHNLSESEAAEVLGEREGTIRVQLSRALAQIRTQLAAGGVTMSAVALPDVLGSLPAPSAPDSLQPSLEHLAQGGRLRPTLRMMAESGGRKKLAGWAVVGALTLGCAAGALWLENDRPSPAQSTAEQPAGKPDAPPATALPAKPAELPHMLETFDQGVPETMGRGIWKAQYKDMKGVLHFKGKLDGVISIPFKLDSRPCMVRIRYCATAASVAEKWDCTVYRVQNDRIFQRKFWRKKLTLLVDKPFDVRFYWIGKYHFTYMDNDLTSIGKFDAPFASDRLLLVPENIVVDEIEAKTLAPDEIPADLRDPEAFVRKMNVTLGEIREEMPVPSPAHPPRKP